MDNGPVSSWGDTLYPFLATSNEDEAYQRLFEDIVPDLFRKGGLPTDRLCWQEIGAGPGTKTRRLYSRLLEQGVRALELEVIERDARWIPLLYDAAFLGQAAAHVSYRFQFSWFEDHVRRVSGATAGSLQPHVVTAFHVIYESFLADHFVRYLTMCPDSLFILSAESPASDLGRLRSALSDIHSITCARSHLPAVVAGAEAEHRRVDIICLTKKWLWLSDRDIGSSLAPGWFMPFLLGISDHEYRGLPSDTRRTCLEEAARALGTEENRFRQVHMPDQVAIIYPQGWDTHA